MRWSRLAPACMLAGSLTPLGCEKDDEGASTSTTAASVGSEAGSGSAGDGASAASGASSDGVAASSEAGSGPSGPEFPCTSVDECYLHGDCCSCVALHRDEPAPQSCPADCDRDACETMGLTQILCSHSCLIELVECDPAMVTCADAPPACPEGQVPSLQERCWSGYCVVADLCRP